MFAGDGVVALPIQGNDPACNGTLCNIKAVCGIMTDDGQGSEARGQKASRGSLALFCLPVMEINENLVFRLRDACRCAPPKVKIGWLFWSVVGKR